MSDQNPGKSSRRAYFAFFVIVIGVVVAFVVLPISTAAIILPFGIVGAIATLAMGYVNSTQAQTRASMERGENLVARWTLDAALWQDFVSLNKGTAAIPHIEANRLAASDLAVEVVFAEEAIFVDGDYYTMDRHWGTKATLEPSYIELLQYGLEDLTPLRIPIPAGLRQEAERVVTHFHSPN